MMASEGLSIASRTSALSKRRRDAWCRRCCHCSIRPTPVYQPHRSIRRLRDRVAAERQHRRTSVSAKRTEPIPKTSCNEAQAGSQPSSCRRSATSPAILLGVPFLRPAPAASRCGPQATFCLLPALAGCPWCNRQAFGHDVPPRGPRASWARRSAPPPCWRPLGSAVALPNSRYATDSGNFAYAIRGIERFVLSTSTGGSRIGRVLKQRCSSLGSLSPPNFPFALDCLSRLPPSRRSEFDNESAWGVSKYTPTARRGSVVDCWAFFRVSQPISSSPRIAFAIALGDATPLYRLMPS